MTDEATRAEKKLAALVLVELDVSIEPAAIRGFIRKNWRTIAPLAHIVHAAPDYTKGDFPPGDADKFAGSGR